jgi:hypothetical protein
MGMDAYETMSKSPSFQGSRDDRTARANQELASLITYTNSSDPNTLTLAGKQRDCDLSMRHLSYCQ